MKSKLTVLLAMAPVAAMAVEIASESMKVTLDEREQCAVTRVVSTGGVELGATRGRAPLFSIKATRCDDFTKSMTIEPGKGSTCAVAKDGDAVRMTYTGLGAAIGKVVCTVRPDGAKLRWNIFVEPNAGWAAETVSYPQILTAENIGTTGVDDAVVAGNAKGGLYRNPAGREVGFCIRATMPGSLTCQFACHYDDSALFYYAAEDGRGYAKNLHADRWGRGVLFQFIRVGFDDKPFDLGYDIVTAAIDGTVEKPTVWQDAADLYRAWARKQTWCAIKPLRDREDLPKWMRDAPAMVRFGRVWLAEPDLIRAWMKDYWRKFFMQAPLVTAFWGWEKHGCWISDYFPVYPSDEQFAALVKDLRKIDAHAFPWPSGYYWILDYDQQADGSYAYTDYEAYAAADGDSHCCITREGKPYRRTPPWLKKGHSTCLCGGDPYTVDWWNKGICLPLVKLGCEMIQTDQTVGGAFQSCWSRKHGHTPGDGLWKRDVFYRQMKTMRETMRAVEPDSVVCFEEPCELYNDLVGIQDYRTCEARSDEWASVFNYVYHEWLPCFQSNPRRHDRVWKAHEAADGQIPHLTPARKDLGGEHPALVNGDFETCAQSGKGFTGWERLEGYAGQVWNGRAYVDREVKHDGAAAMRLESRKDENRVQVSQNVEVDGKAFRVGGKYRISAWLKTAKADGRSHIGFCQLASGVKGVGGAKALEFPKPEEGWKLATTEFTLAKGAQYLRIMNEAVGDATVWIDSMKLEEVLPDGKTKDVVMSGRDAYDAFMRAWVDLYHGRGRDWLAHGRQIRPPVLDCGTVPFAMTLYGGTKYEGRRPAVFHSAWESLDGRKALVFVNATPEEQQVGYRLGGETRSLKLKPDEIRFLEAR